MLLSINFVPLIQLVEFSTISMISRIAIQFNQWRVLSWFSFFMFYIHLNMSISKEILNWKWQICKLNLTCFVIWCKGRKGAILWWFCFSSCVFVWFCWFFIYYIHFVCAAFLTYIKKQSFSYALQSYHCSWSFVFLFIFIKLPIPSYMIVSYIFVPIFF